MRGVVGIDRGVFEHEFFADEEFSEREAWIWIVAEAAWKERTRRVGDYTSKLQRGQLLVSVRFLAEKWGWTKSRVDRFLNRLKIETMIETDSGTGITVITVCNYDKFQKVSLPCETDEGTQTGQMRDSTGTDAGQMRDNTERNKNNKNIKNNKTTNAREPALLDDWPSNFRELFWEAYPHKVGKSDALSKLEKTRRRGIPWDSVMSGLLAYVKSKPVDRPWCNPATWLNQDRWEDQPKNIVLLKPGDRSKTMDEICPPEIYRGLL